MVAAIACEAALDEPGAGASKRRPTHRADHSKCCRRGAGRQSYSWSGTRTEADYPRDTCVHELFEAQAAGTPEAIAVVYGDETVTYGELNARANRLAHHLRGLGVKPDARVAICVERSLEMVVGLLAVLKAGGAYVPLDPAYPRERLAFMLKDSAPLSAHLLTSARRRLLLRRALARRCLPWTLDADADLWASEPASNPIRQFTGRTDTSPMSSTPPAPPASQGGHGRASRGDATCYVLDCVRSLTFERRATVLFCKPRLRSISPVWSCICP